MSQPTHFLLATVVAATVVHADALLTEPFAYPDGELQATSSGNWTIAVDSGNPALSIADEALQWDFTGPSADPPNNGWYGTPFSDSKYDSVPIYAHFDLTVQTAPAIEAGMFAGFWNGGSGIRARVWIGIGRDAEGADVANTFRLGLTESSGSRSGVVWDDQNFAAGTTVRVVIKYDFTAASMFIDAADESDVAITVDDGASYGLNGYAFRHKDDGNLGRFSVDNLAISLGFEDVGAITLEAPTKLFAHPVPGERIFLSWKDGSTLETGFRVDRAIDGGDFSPLANLDPNKNYYIDEVVETGTTYCYQVVATGAPDSPPSASACAIPQTDPVVAVEPRLDAAAGDHELHFTVQSQRGVSYLLNKSSDLADWAAAEPPLGGAEAEIDRTLPVATSPAFYRLSGRYFPVPADVGLTMAFEMPENGGGAVLNLADYGATSDDPTDNDAIAFVSALAAAQAGDTLLIPAGTYHLKSPVSVKSGIIIQGADRDSVVLLSDATMLDNIFNIPSGAADITLEDFTIGLHAGTLVHGVAVGTKTGSLVHRVWIRHLHIEGFEQRGVQVRQAQHVKVEDCRIFNATALGGGGMGYGVALNDTKNNNNWVTGCIIGPVIRHGILIQYQAHHNLVEANTIFETTEDAIDLHGEDEYGNEVRFNLCFWDDPSGWDGTPVGIGIGNTGATHDDSGPDNWIHHNEVYGYNAGLEIILDSHHQYIDGNYFHDNVLGGINLYNGGGDGVALRGNWLIDNGTFGIRAESSNALRVEANRINGHSTGVEVAANAPGYIVTGNDLTGNTVAKDLGNDDGTYTDNAE